jgi:hypothetical protein
MKFVLSRQVFEKYSNNKFHETPFSGKPSFSMRTEGQAGMAKLTVAVRNFGNALKSP